MALVEEPLEIDQEMADSPIRPQIDQIMQAGGWQLLRDAEDAEEKRPKKKAKIQEIEHTPRTFFEDSMVKTIVEAPFGDEEEIPVNYKQMAGDFWEVMQRDWIPSQMVEKLLKNHPKDEDQLEQIRGSFYDPLAMARLAS